MIWRQSSICYPWSTLATHVLLIDDMSLTSSMTLMEDHPCSYSVGSKKVGSGLIVRVALMLCTFEGLNINHCLCKVKRSPPPHHLLNFYSLLFLSFLPCPLSYITPHSFLSKMTHDTPQDQQRQPHHHQQEQQQDFKQKLEALYSQSKSWFDRQKQNLENLEAHQHDINQTNFESVANVKANLQLTRSDVTFLRTNIRAQNEHIDEVRAERIEKLRVNGAFIPTVIACFTCNSLVYYFLWIAANVDRQEQATLNNPNRHRRTTQTRTNILVSLPKKPPPTRRETRVRPRCHDPPRRNPRAAILSRNKTFFFLGWK